MNELTKKIEDAKATAMANPTAENVQTLENLVNIAKIQAEQTSVVESKPALSERAQFAKKLREALGNMPTGSTIAVPLEVSAEIERKRNEISKLRRFCTVHPCTGNYTLQVEGTGVTVSYVAEHAAIGDGTPTINAISLTAYKLGALVKMSNEFIQDEAADIVAYITNLIADGFAKMEDSEILNGTGSSYNHMTGIVPSCSANTVTCATAKTVTWKEVKTTIQKLTKGYRNNATCVMSQELADAIHEMKDGSNYIFPQNEPISTILGIPVVISADLGNLESGKAMMVVGDFSYYHIADRKDLTVKKLEELYAQNDQTGVLAVQRIDGKPSQVEAFAVLVSKAA